MDLADDEVLAGAAEQLAEYASGHRDGFDLPLRPSGSERARQVWDLVAAVPRGETTTYAALGRAVGVGPRAAGQFVARNPLCVVVPCHRVVASDGRLTGYAGGVDRKRQLLQLEGALTAGASVVPAPAAESDDGSRAGRRRGRRGGGGRRMSRPRRGAGRRPDSHLERLLGRLVEAADADGARSTSATASWTDRSGRSSSRRRRPGWSGWRSPARGRTRCCRSSPTASARGCCRCPGVSTRRRGSSTSTSRGGVGASTSPLDWQLSSGFRRDVLGHLAVDVEYGHTTSYAGLASLSGSPRAVRAVGTACATNPIPVVVPCHRVVRSDGTMGRYRGGEEAKHALLELEGVR